jgi:hypothetical protein
MQRRSAAIVETDTEQQALYRKLDFYSTPPWGARAGLEHAKRLWPDAKVMREPACGELHIARPASDYFDQVIASDVHAHSPSTPVRDWLDDGAWPAEPDCDIVFTNPPFAIADQFVLKGLQRSRMGVALLLRIAFLEGGERYAILGGEKAQLTQVVTFCERVPMTLGVWDPEASSAAAYAWFFWSKVHDPLPPAWFPPGTRDRLWRRDDPAQFGKLNPMPLFPDPVPDFDVI